MSDADEAQLGGVFIRVLLLALITAGSLFTSSFALAATQVNTNITTNTTWTTNGSPYIIKGSLKTATGTTLTINPGVVVKFADQSGLRVEGRLLANGTVSSRVYFTSIKDDSVGGDSNSDGSLTKASPQDWRTLIFAPGSTGQFAYSTIRYAGYFFGSTDTSPAVFNTGGSIMISNSEVSSSYLFGVGQLNGSLKISSSTISKNDTGIAIKGGTVELIGNTLASNAIGILDDGNNPLKLTRNIIKDGSHAIVFYPNRQRSIVQTGTTATNNQYNGIVLAGSVTGPFVLSAAKDPPYLVLNGGGSTTGTGKLIFPPTGFEVSNTGALTFVAGTVVKFESHARLPVYGRLITSGSTNAPVVFTSAYDNTVGGKAVKAGLPPARGGDWGDIQLKPKSQVNLNYTVLRYGGGTAPNSDSTVFNQGGTLIGSYIQVVDGGQFGIRHVTGTTTIRNSTISDHYTYGILNESTKPIDARINYWGDPSGPWHPVTNSKAFGDAVSDYVTYASVLTSPHVSVPQTPCCSSVLFLPGIMGTRLYEGTDKRWEPRGENDIVRLYLNTSGTSVNTVQAKEVIGTFDGPLLFNEDLYKNFLNDLYLKKTSGYLNNYIAYGYDWRLSLDKILADNKLVDTVKSLAKSSKTGKVTVVSHSNGGLLAKKLINQLGADSSRFVDEVILVGTPQLGTPQAIGSLLHGFDSGIPLRYSKARARDFAKNSPMSYNLVPHSDYFNSTGVGINVPLATFEPGNATNIFIGKYGYGINTTNELFSFLRGLEGRRPAAFDNLNSPAIVNSALLSNSDSEIQSINNSWVPPVGIKLQQIAGVGVETVYQIEYKTVNDVLQYTPKFTIDGDETVIEPSALATSVSDRKARRWWFNLQKYKQVTGSNNGRHRSLLELGEIRSLIFNNIIGTSTNNSFGYISSLKPALVGGNHIDFILHSSLSLSYIDTEGVVVNESNPENKHAVFRRFGEVQVIHVYDQNPGVIKLTGENKSPFTLEVEETSEGKVVYQTSFNDVPSKAITEAFININKSSSDPMSRLQINFEGNSSTDSSQAPVNGEDVIISNDVKATSTGKLIDSAQSSTTPDIMETDR